MTMWRNFGGQEVGGLTLATSVAFYDRPHKVGRVNQKNEDAANNPANRLLSDAAQEFLRAPISERFEKKKNS